MSYSSSRLIRPKAILLDMDGVLYHGHRVLPHAIDFMRKLQPVPHVFITNNPILLPHAVVTKLANMGFPKPDVGQVLTSGIAAAEYLASQQSDYRFYAIGAEGLHHALEKYGTASDTDADFVVVGEGEGIDFNTLAIGIQLIVNNKARLICTNPDASVDAFCDGKRCILPGGGALVAPLSIATGVTPVTIGKPFPLLYEMALAQLGLTAAECLMIGDRPDTDILGAQQLGMQTALVRTGRFAVGDKLPDGICPDYDVVDMARLSECLFFEH